ncbi:MAG: hypothetical protein MUE69_33845 [Myxococcota bacterium]|jgi:hypothetical protein|nr:hypothetical protein [Myxococcota bacterium]
MSTRAGLSIRLSGAASPIAIDLNTSERAAVDAAAAEAGLGPSAWAAAVLGGTVPDGAGLSRRAAVRELVLAAAGISAIAAAAQRARARHLALVRAAGGEAT